jgi:hypothetical protein
MYANQMSMRMRLAIQSPRGPRVRGQDSNSQLRKPHKDSDCSRVQCAELTKSGHVHAVATEDMDALCCGAKVLVRRLTMSEARKQPIQEFVLEKVLTEIDLDMDRQAYPCTVGNAGRIGNTGTILCRGMQCCVGECT